MFTYPSSDEISSPTRRTSSSKRCRHWLSQVPDLRFPNPWLNLAFVANLFNTWPGLAPLDEQEAQDYGVVGAVDAEGEREARVFTLWLNSLGVEPGVFSLFENLKDGLIILQAFDKIVPGRSSGDASRNSRGIRRHRQSLDCGEEQEDIGITPKQSTLSRFKQVENTNTNYAVELGKQNGMHLTGIVDRVRTLVLGFVCQFMRFAFGPG